VPYSREWPRLLRSKQHLLKVNKQGFTTIPNLFSSPHAKASNFPLKENTYALVLEKGAPPNNFLRLFVGVSGDWPVALEMPAMHHFPTNDLCVYREKSYRQTEKCLVLRQE
jgi:uncharacterized pyridoxal phosphate-containing UPF0001 family protein